MAPKKEFWILGVMMLMTVPFFVGIVVLSTEALNYLYNMRRWGGFGMGPVASEATPAEEEGILPGTAAAETDTFRKMDFFWMRFYDPDTELKFIMASAPKVIENTPLIMYVMVAYGFYTICFNYDEGAASHFRPAKHGMSLDLCACTYGNIHGILME